MGIHTGKHLIHNYYVQSISLILKINDCASHNFTILTFLKELMQVINAMNHLTSYKGFLNCLIYRRINIFVKDLFSLLLFDIMSQQNV